MAFVSFVSLSVGVTPESHDEARSPGLGCNGLKLKQSLLLQLLERMFNRPLAGETRPAVAIDVSDGCSI